MKGRLTIRLRQCHVERPNCARHKLLKADEDDNKFVDCAIAGNAIFIVSEDKHFNELAMIPFPKVEVIGIDDFMKYLNR